VQSEYQIILSTCPDRENAEKLANLLIEQNLAACVNIVPGLTSIYKWKGEIQTGTELLLIIKTRSDRYTEIESIICAHHPYELPEIISVPLQHGLKNYLDWIDNTTGK